jgi:hypothetical protein
MINPEEYKRVCRLAKLIEVTNSKTTAFKTLDQTEGIELVGGKIQTFSIITMKDGTKEKVISEKPISKDIIAVIGAFEKDSRNIADEKPKIPCDTKGSQAEEPKKGIISNPINAIPEILEEKRIITPQDIEAWKKLSTFERILLFQKTSKGLIKQRRGCLLPEFAGKDKKTLTNDHFKMFTYLDGNVMKHSANIAFLFEWSCVVESEKYFDNEVCVRGYIQVEINGKMYRRACGGSGIKKGIMDWGDTMESAITEMTKRGIYHFLHGDVKRGEFDEN